MRRYKIGYTTGVFDMFHVGHLNIIHKAKQQCDHLIVGVSTDDLVEEYKHKRPVIPFEERIEIIRALRDVDEVVPQTSMDKYAAWEYLRYDVLFHGDDWKDSEMYRRVTEKLSSVGVDVVYFARTPGISSTQLRSAKNEKID